MAIYLRGFSLLAAATVMFATARPTLAQPGPDADEANPLFAEVAEAVAELADATAPAFDSRPREDLSGVYTIDFRNQRFDPRTLMPLGHDSLYGLRLLKPEPRGLRIIIPSHQGETKPNIGITPAFEIDGDFQISAAYDLVTAETPTRGAGAGANLYLMTSGTRQGATLRRCVSPGGEHVYFLHWTVPNEEGKLQMRWKYVPAESRSGQLSLERRGSMLHYLAADGTGELKEIHHVDFGTAPIGLLRLEANTDGSASTVDVMWHNFTVRAEKLRSVAIPLYDDATAVSAGETENDSSKAAVGAK